MQYNKRITINQSNSDPDYIGMIKILSLIDRGDNPFYGRSISEIGRLLLERPIEEAYNKFVVKEKWDVFLSYNYTDRDFANKTYHELTSRGLSVWYDRVNITGGEKWSNAVERGLKSSLTMVALFGKRADSKALPQREIHSAISRGLKEREMPIVPVIIPGAKQKDIPLFLRDRTFFDLRTFNTIESEKLVKHIYWLQNKLDDLLPSNPRVFLCHAKEDEGRVEEIYYIMKDHGLDPWYDKEKLIIGDRWEQEIIQAIEQSDFFAVFLSATSIKKRGFIQREIRTASREFQFRPQGTIFFLPIRLENFRVPHIKLDENSYLSDFQWFDAFEGDENAIVNLSNNIKLQWDKRQGQKNTVNQM